MPLALPPLIVIVGTNASGKSSLGIVLASEFGGEIVSADSRQVYRGLDIGTGKVSAEERGQVPHHLLDVADPRDDFTLADYVRFATAAIDDIHRRGRLPFLVGGTGLYVSAIVENYRLPAAPPDPSLRRELEALNMAALRAELVEKDSVSAARIGPQDRVRTARALEIIRQTGQPLSQSQAKGPPRYDSLVLGLTWPRPILHRRIDDRVDRRLQEGMIAEVEGLLRSGVPPERLYRLGLEYGIICQHLCGAIPSESEMVATLKVAIHAFARRQMTWFRPKPYVRWLDSAGDYRAEARALIQEYLAGRKS